MTKIISVLVVVLVLYGGWHLFLYWEDVKNQEAAAKKTEAAAITTGDQLQGLPQGLEPTLQAAKNQGATGLRNWLKTYGKNVQDPRKAWIELDYCVLVARDDPSEARKVFAEVKGRTPAASPVMPRIKQLEKTYQ
jgi:hypothetical protein